MTQKVSENFKNCAGGGGGGVLDPKGAMVTGNIYGLDYSYHDAHTIHVEKGTCYDSKNETVLSLVGDVAVSIPSTAGTVLNLFLCNDGTIKSDTDVDGATLTGSGVTALRWVGFVANDNNGNIIQFGFSGNVFTYLKTAPVTFMSGINNTKHTISDYSHIVPTGRVAAIMFAGTSTKTEKWMQFYNAAGARLSIVSTTSLVDTFYSSSGGTPIFLPPDIVTDVMFASGDGTGTVLIYQVKLKR